MGWGVFRALELVSSLLFPETLSAVVFLGKLLSLLALPWELMLLLSVFGEPTPNFVIKPTALLFSGVWVPMSPGCVKGSSCCWKPKPISIGPRRDILFALSY